MHLLKYLCDYCKDQLGIAFVPLGCTLLQLPFVTTFQVIGTNTKDVLEAELSTVVTVFKQEALNIESGLDLFTAVERYARSLDSKSVEPLDNLKSLKLEPQTSRLRKQSQDLLEFHWERLPQDSINKLIDSMKNRCQQVLNNRGTSTIHDAVQQIRFLTLTAQQFAEGPACSSLLTRDESFAILMNILSKSTETAMPSGLSTSRKSRDKTNEYGMKEATIRLVVINFNDQNEDVWSDTVIVQSLPWRIEMVPGIKSDLNRQVSVYLTCDSVKGSKYWSCVVESEFTLLSSRPYIKPSRAEDLIFSSGSSSMGYPRFIRWAAVVDPANGYIRNGTVTFEVHFIVKKVQTY